MTECRDGDVDAETEFFQPLLEPSCVFCRKVPMHTVQFYSGKLATGYRLDHTPKKAFFVSSEQTQLCFKFPKIKSGDIVLSLNSCSKVLTSPELLL